MSIEDIIRAWKASEECEEITPLTNPVGEELSPQELQEVVGGMLCPCTGVTSCSPDASWPF